MKRTVILLIASLIIFVSTIPAFAVSFLPPPKTNSNTTSFLLAIGGLLIIVIGWKTFSILDPNHKKKSSKHSEATYESEEDMPDEDTTLEPKDDNVEITTEENI